MKAQFQVVEPEDDTQSAQEPFKTYDVPGPFLGWPACEGLDLILLSVDPDAFYEQGQR